MRHLGHICVSYQCSFHVHVSKIPYIMILNNYTRLKASKTYISNIETNVHLPSGNTCLIFRYDVVSLIMEALSNCDVIALGSGNNLARLKNSSFSFSLRVRAAFLLFSFIAHCKDKAEKKKYENLYILTNYTKAK